MNSFIGKLRADPMSKHSGFSLEKKEYEKSDEWLEEFESISRIEGRVKKGEKWWWCY